MTRGGGGVIRARDDWSLQCIAHERLPLLLRPEEQHQEEGSTSEARLLLRPVGLLPRPLLRSNATSVQRTPLLLPQVQQPLGQLEVPASVSGLVMRGRPRPLLQLVQLPLRLPQRRFRPPYRLRHLPLPHPPLPTGHLQSLPGSPSRRASRRIRRVTSPRGSMLPPTGRRSLESLVRCPETRSGMSQWLAAS